MLDKDVEEFDTWHDLCLFKSLINISLVFRFCVPNSLQSEQNCDKMMSLMDVNQKLLAKTPENNCTIKISSFNNMISQEKGFIFKSYFVKLIENMLKFVTTAENSNAVRFAFRLSFTYMRMVY